MDTSDDESFTWTAASSYSESEDSDDVKMTRGNHGKSKRFTRDASESSDKTRDSSEQRQPKKTKKSKIKEEPLEDKAKVKNIGIKKEYDSQDSDGTDLDVLVKREREENRHRVRNQSVSRSGSEQPQPAPTPTPSPSPAHNTEQKSKKHKHVTEHTYNGENTEANLSHKQEEDVKWLKSEKKKSKKNKSNSSSVISDTVIEDVEHPSGEQVNGDLSDSEKKDIQNEKRSKKSKVRNTSLSINEDTGSCIEDNEVNVNKNGLNESVQKHSTKKSKSNQDMPKISDRIQFEDDPSLDTIENHSDITPQLRRFLQSNPAFSIATLSGESLITKDDDLFLLKCPQELDVILLEHKDLVLDSKCKFKLDGHTYDGSLEEQNSRIAILAVSHNKSNVVNLPLSGIANFRKRIPKAHYLLDNVMANDQSNFIPLPDTKCRHPLFGAHYKKAIKIPAAVKARLNMAAEAENVKEPEKIKKKKSKMKTHSQMEDEEEPVQTKREPADEEGERQRKGKKRRAREEAVAHTAHEDAPHTTPHKRRKVKHGPTSPPAWDSERAIEQNLFDF